MSFFDKLKNGLSGTRQAIKNGIDNVFAVFSSVDDELFNELEETLIMADVGAEASMEIIDKLRERTKSKRISDGEQAKEELYAIISEMLGEETVPLNISTKPAVILVVGVNGVGKTTSIGKLANKLKNDGKSVMLAAGDTFRAAAAEQLTIWAQRIGCPVVKHGEGADPAAVVFDAVNSAKAKNIDVLICDTAGRLHNKKNLMDELEKIYRVIKRELPDAAIETLLVLDAATGQNAVSQAREFAAHTEVSGIILTKLDGTAKGGIVVSISHDRKLPVKFIGVGEGIEDLDVFVPSEFARALFE